ncbi:MAG: hypothetical protein WD096_11875 [Actinomycetota bacterium]
MADAKALSPFDILRPSSDVLPDSEIATVWIEDRADATGGGEVQVAIVYADGTQIYLLAAPPDAESSYERIAKEIPTASVGTIFGHPGIFIERDADIDAADPGSVAFVMGDVEVTVYGDASVEDLIRIAESVEVRPG